MRTKKTNSTNHDRRTLADTDHTRPATIDYGPALDAIGDLFKWAFGLAEQDVKGWPEGLRRVRAVRRYLLKSLHGAPSRCPSDDTWFVAGLLARIFEAELRLPYAAIVRMLGELELPTDVVPRVVRTAPISYDGVVIRRYPTPEPKVEIEPEIERDWIDEEDAYERHLERFLVAAQRRATSAAPAASSCAAVCPLVPLVRKTA